MRDEHNWGQKRDCQGNVGQNLGLSLTEMQCGSRSGRVQRRQAAWGRHFWRVLRSVPIIKVIKNFDKKYHYQLSTDKFGRCGYGKRDKSRCLAVNIKCNSYTQVWHYAKMCGLGNETNFFFVKPYTERVNLCRSLTFKPKTKALYTSVLYGTEWNK